MSLSLAPHYFTVCSTKALHPCTIGSDCYGTKNGSGSLSLSRSKDGDYESRPDVLAVTSKDVRRTAYSYGESAYTHMDKS